MCIYIVVCEEPGGQRPFLWASRELKKNLFVVIDVRERSKIKIKKNSINKMEGICMIRLYGIYLLRPSRKKKEKKNTIQGNVYSTFRH